jgi:hypothetical protein
VDTTASRGPRGQALRELPRPPRTTYRSGIRTTEEQPVMMRHTSLEPQQRLSLRGEWCVGITAASVDNFKALGRWRG